MTSILIPADNVIDFSLKKLITHHVLEIQNCCSFATCCNSWTRSTWLFLQCTLRLKNLGATFQSSLCLYNLHHEHAPAACLQPAQHWCAPGCIILFALSLRSRPSLVANWMRVSARYQIFLLCGAEILSPNRVTARHVAGIRANEQLGEERLQIVVQVNKISNFLCYIKKNTLERHWKGRTPTELDLIISKTKQKSNSWCNCKH